jgi:hypothetical protein
MVPVYKKYADKLLQDGTMTQKEISDQEHLNEQALLRAYMTSKEDSFNVADWKARPWEVVNNPIA